MGDSQMIVRFVALVALVAVFAVTMQDWDASAPQVSGWAAFQTAVTSDPWADSPPLNWTVGNWTTPAECDWWDIPCHVGNALGFIASAVVALAELVYSAVRWVVDGLGWLGNLLVSFFGALFGSATLTYDEMPGPVQAILWVVIAPLLALVILAVLRYIRGVD